MTLKQALEEINKEFGPNTIGRFGDMQQVALKRVLSGIPTLDYALGGGWPLGRIVEIYGVEASGKTLTTLLTIASAQKQGLQVALIDAENSFHPQFARELGIDTDNLIVSQSSIGETTIDIMLSLMKAKPDIIVLDSVAAMVPQAELANPTEKDTMALTARVMGKALRKFTAVNKSTLLILVNQLRSTLAMYGAPTITPGGRAIKHFASIRVEIANGGFIEDKKEKTGQLVKFRVVKNKTSPPWRQGHYTFFYGRGGQKPSVDFREGLVALALQLGVISRSGASYDVLGKKVQTKENLAALLWEDKDLYEQLQKEILKYGGNNERIKKAD